MSLTFGRHKRPSEPKIHGALIADYRKGPNTCPVIGCAADLGVHRLGSACRYCTAVALDRFGGTSKRVQTKR